MGKVVVLIGSGQIGQAIARCVGSGHHVVLADMRPENTNAAAEIFRNAGFDVSVAAVDVSSRSLSACLRNRVQAIRPY
jgi:saccharopine dehydrogenase-like NADP-dependent oxidoreductase